MKQPTDREIKSMLRAHESAPESIVPAVLVRTALADQYVTMEGPLGTIYVGFTINGISCVVPTGSEEQFLVRHEVFVGRPAYRVPAMPRRLETALRRSLDTGRLGKLPVDLRQLTLFQRQALDVTAQIPPGEVRPYSWVARQMGNDGAVRAVGSALARNPVPIVIPCHRVVKSDGSVGNYAFGPQMKARLLAHEGMDPTLFAPGSPRYVGSDTTGIYCFPTCRNARRISAQHRIEFRFSGVAEDAGYRACEVCRPC